MPHVSGLRSPYDKVGRLVYFGRMLDKIRLNAAGKLPPDYLANLGDQKPGLFDARCCRLPAGGVFGHQRAHA
jgi:gluconokinase